MNKKLFSTVLGAVMLLSIGSNALAWESTKVYYSDQGVLQYAADANNNQIVDFSYAGYHRGEINIPDSSTLTAVTHVSPISGDNTAHIQQAINTVAGWTPNSNGIRGVVKLAAGDYPIHGTLYVNVSGVILSGSGPHDQPSTDTILRRPYGGSVNKDAVIIVGGNVGSNWSGGDTVGNRINITSNMVNVGSRSFTVASTSGLAVGDNIVIKHPATQAWINSVGGGGTDSDSNWSVDSLPLIFNRYITGISGTTITIDAPITNKLDKSLSQSYLYKYDRANLVTEVGVENLQVTIDTKTDTSEDHAEEAIIFKTVEDGWIDRVKVKHFVNKGITLQTTSRVTVQNSYSIWPRSKMEGGRRYNFAVESGQLNLFIGNYANQGRHAYIGNGASWDSGNVFVDNTSDATYDVSEVHRKWGHGFLYENHMELNLRSTNKLVLGLYNRGDYGTAHGWSTANSVLWNCNVGTGKAVVERPPTAENYAIGCKGNISGSGPFSSAIPTTPGFIEGTGQTQLSIPSLYRAQLAQRLNYMYTASADAFVRGGDYTNVNYGSNPVLEVKNANSSDFDRKGYIKIDFTGYNRGQIGKAYLNFHVESNEPAQPITFYGLTNDTWSESTIKWNNTPSDTGAVLIGTVNTAAPGWYSVDVTSYVKSQTDKIVTFKLNDDSGVNQITNISSKESSTYEAPFLIVTPN